MFAHMYPLRAKEKFNFYKFFNDFEKIAYDLEVCRMDPPSSFGLASNFFRVGKKFRSHYTRRVSTLRSSTKSNESLAQTRARARSIRWRRVTNKLCNQFAVISTGWWYFFDHDTNWYHHIESVGFLWEGLMVKSSLLSNHSRLRVEIIANVQITSSCQTVKKNIN